MEFTRESLEAAGFQGFVRFENLPDSDVPESTGVYMVLRPDLAQPVFGERSIGGWFKGRDPSVPVERLEARWLADARVLYIGMAGRVRGGLAKRLDEYRRHGTGERVGHWGGRLIWQLASSDELLVCWRVSVGASPAGEESELIRQFEEQYGGLPFANLRH